MNEIIDLTESTIKEFFKKKNIEANTFVKNDGIVRVCFNGTDDNAVASIKDGCINIRARGELTVAFMTELGDELTRVMLESHPEYTVRMFY